MLRSMNQSQEDPRARSSFNKRNIRYSDAMRAMEDVLRQGGDPRQAFERRGIKYGPFLQAMEELLRNSNGKGLGGGSDGGTSYQSNLNDFDQKLNGINNNNNNNNKEAARQQQRRQPPSPGADNLDDMLSKMLGQFGLNIAPSQLGNAAQRFGVDPSQMREAMGMGGQQQEGTALEKYGIDFTKKAQDGKLDPLIGRDEEVHRAIQILSRRSKNNVCFVGDPGVGKSANRSTYDRW